MIKQRINEKTNNIYKGFLIKKAEYNIAKNLLDVVFIFPEKFYKQLKVEDKEVIKKTLEEIINEKMNIKVEFEYSFGDAYLIKNTVCKFLAKKEPLYSNNISPDDIEVVANDRDINITFTLDSGTYSFFTSTDFKSSLIDYFAMQFTQEVHIKLICDESKDAILQTNNPIITNIYSSKGTRTTNITDIERLIGRPFIGVPSYIVDLQDNPKEQVVVCGKVSNVNAKFNEKIQKTMLRFNLNDTTATIPVVKFDKSKGKEYEKLEDGMEVVVQGKASINSYNDKMQMIVNNISTCKIDYSSINLEPVYKEANLYYINAFPEKYVEMSQTSLFDQKSEVTDYLKGKTFVAFDLETTGLSATDRIIEIGAAKMVDGEITEIFNTLVNPEMHIPESASDVNHIYDVDVANAPKIEDVFPDFYKFIEDFPLVAHNIDYDIGYVNQVAKGMNYKVKNEQFDTLKLARQYLKLPKYKLQCVCDYYGIDIVNAHRACYDAVACLKVFKNLADFM